MTTVRVPTLSLLLGEGSGGGAIAFLPADRVVAAEHAWLAPIAPEGASAILHRTTARAAELASAQATSSTDLRGLGIVDVVIPDRPAAADEGERFGDRIAATAARRAAHAAVDRRRRASARPRRPLPPRPRHRRATVVERAEKALSPPRGHAPPRPCGCPRASAGR
jgi:acyl-CoA carboxylase subunit beta